MIGFYWSVCWRPKRRRHTDFFLLFYNKRLSCIIILFYYLIQLAQALTGIEFNVDPNNIAAVNSQLKRKNSEVQEYSAIINGEVLLPCNISAPSIEDSVALILWYRAGGKNAIYTVDARYTPSLKEAKHFISPALKNRVQLNCDNGLIPLDLLKSFTNTKLNFNKLNRTKRSSINKQFTANPLNKLTNIKNAKMPLNKKSKSVMIDSIKPQTERRCTLRIKPVQHEDGMVDYRCRVDFKRGRTINYNMYLNLIVPSTKLEIYAGNSETNELVYKNVDNQNKELTKEIGPFKEDEQLNLTCVSAGGNPPPSVLWFDGDENLIDDSYERTIVSQVNRVVNILNLGSLNKSHQDRAYTCKVSNSDLNEPIQQTVQLKVDLKPKDLKIEPKPSVIKEKEKIILTCKCSNCKQPAQLLWFRENQQIENENLIETELNNENELISKLKWTIASEDNDKKFICKLINSRFSNFTLEDKLQLNVQFLPSVSLVFGSSRGDEELVEGSDIFFQCNINSNPVVSSVQWLFNGKLLIEELKSNEIDQNNIKKLNSQIHRNELNLNFSQSNLNNDYLDDKIAYNNLDTSIQIVDELQNKSNLISIYDKNNLTIGSNRSMKEDEKILPSSLNKLRQKRKITQNNESIIQLPNISISDRSLLLKGASGIHSGEWQCTGKNEIGTGYSDIIPLHVHFAPRCADNQPLQYVLKQQETASISCEVEADPAEVQFHWLLLSGSGELTSETILNTAYESYQTKQSNVAPFTSFYHHFHNPMNPYDSNKILKDNSPNIKFTIEHMSLNLNQSNQNSSYWQSGQPNLTVLSKPIRVRSLATYTPKHNTHYGVLQCWATNLAGNQKQPCTFFVLAAQAPEPPLNCTTTNVTISSLTVECKPGYSGGLPQKFYLEVYTKQTEYSLYNKQEQILNKQQKNNLKELNEILIEEGNIDSLSNITSSYSGTNTPTTTTTISSTPLPTKVVLINGKPMILLHNLTAEEYPFFSLNTLPAGNSFYLITYAKNIRGVSKKIEITANTLTAERWQTADVLVDYLERTVITTPILISIVVACCLSIFLLTTILIVRLRSLKKVHNNTNKNNCNKNSDNKSSKENLPYELCLPLETINTDLHSQNSFHHRLLLQYPTLQNSTNHLNHLTNSTHQLNYVCGTDSCGNTNCDQLLSHSFLDTTSGEITLESFDNTTLNRRTIPVSILPSNQTTNLISSINSPLTCGHLLNINQQNSTICNSIDQNSNTSIDQTTTTNSLEQNTNRVFFIRTSNADHLNQLNQNLHNNKVQITDTGYNDKTKQDLDQMLYLTTSVNQQQNPTDQYDYYKILNRTPINFDPYGNDQNFDLNYNGLELLTNSYLPTLHEQVINLNNEKINCNKTHLDNLDKEISNAEILDNNTMESNQSVSLNNKTLNWIVVEQGKEKNQTLTSV